MKNFNLDIPVGKLIVVTGLSGAGKSSLVFETLHAEGQYRYVQTFSAYTRQFLEALDKPDVDSIENIRPSIAIQQNNSVRTSRSTVGTMTELCDYFKVWFAGVSQLHDPETDELIEPDHPQRIWEKLQRQLPSQSILVCFKITKPAKLNWESILESLRGQGYVRLIREKGVVRLEELDLKILGEKEALYVVQDRIEVSPDQQTRFIDAATSAFHYGRSELFIFQPDGQRICRFFEGFRSNHSGESFEPATPALFSFNSPVGACSSCEGFGRTVGVDLSLVIPDERLSLKQGAIRVFSGEVFSRCQKDLLKACRQHKVPVNIPWSELATREKDFVLHGEDHFQDSGDPEEWAGWYGVYRFFSWIESKSYKTHMRIFLSRYRSYIPCRTCKGKRFNAHSLNWKWRGHTLADLYAMPVDELEIIFGDYKKHYTDKRLDIAADSILTRLNYLKQVGLGYLTLDRTSRTLSGGEVQRVNLTTCLGTSLVDTLFVLDEPSIGLHARDIDRLIGILKGLTALGNTVVVVEHDEAMMEAADHLIEIGPRPGRKGGQVIFQGDYDAIMASNASITGAYLRNEKQIFIPSNRRTVCIDSKKQRKSEKTPQLIFEGIYKNNIQGLDLRLPLQRLVCLSGVSGSGKSTLLNNVIYQSIQEEMGRKVEENARVGRVSGDLIIREVTLVDQSPVSRTPRSNPALFSGAWDGIRELFAMTESARIQGLSATHFSFNSGDGRCDHCQGLGYERVEMQFLSDVYVNCSVCDGKRFKEEVLSVELEGHNIHSVLSMDIQDAAIFFRKSPRIASPLKALNAVGLGYLQLGQPLNTLSGGECQRLKLVKYLHPVESYDRGHVLILLDEPTAGLHRDDIRTLIKVLQSLVDKGHSLVVIEHQMDLLKSADWIIEMGPDAGKRGGQIVFEGTPEELAGSSTETAPFIKEALETSLYEGESIDRIPFAPMEVRPQRIAAQEGDAFEDQVKGLHIYGAREHNLKNVTLHIPQGTLSVITGVSGSGKSSLVFDVIFAEGQRRFLESMSSYAQQFVSRLPRPEVDRISGIAPTVAIEQRLTSGNNKSTVGTATEVLHYLRLLYSLVGIQHSVHSGQPLQAQSKGMLKKRLLSFIKQECNEALMHLAVPVVRGRKGHHEPLAKWARSHGYRYLRCDKKMVPVESFQQLDRYKEHDIELIIDSFDKDRAAEIGPEEFDKIFENLMHLGKGSFLLLSKSGEVLSWFSQKRTDPETGEAYPELDPKHFSWNSAQGCCHYCQGNGQVVYGSKKDNASKVCPECEGDRLNPVSRAVHLHLKGGETYNLPNLLRQTPKYLLDSLSRLSLDERGQQILKSIYPQVKERIQFMEQVGLHYLTLDRATTTLSGGEAQRIRLAGQIGSNLSGVLYILDEPSIGLHARNNDQLIASLKQLRDKNNTVLVVEHDEDMMRAADMIIDLGPGAGIHGGEILGQGHWESLTRSKDSLTGQYLLGGMTHPARGHYRSLPKPFSKRSKKDADWVHLEGLSFRNLKNFDLSLPLNRLNVVCGVSGAGKSTLVRDVLDPVIRKAIESDEKILSGDQLTNKNGFGFGLNAPLRKLYHGNAFNQVVEVDQSPIGKTPRSSPVTYIGAFDLIRNYFAMLPEAKMRGLTASSFSFNTKGGRCETCKGAGRIRVEMNFLPDTQVPCDECKGTRYGEELSNITWKGKSIHQILEMTFEEAASFFDFHSQIKALMDLMVETGLGYLTLGQSSPTLSGGEAQRLKLVSELASGLPTFRQRSRGVLPRNLYLLEEPTIGLHFSDCERLIYLLHRLVDQGHTVVVIEHHLDIIAEADYLVEIGPEGGEAGGHLLFQGSLEAFLKQKDSPTLPYLKGKLEGTRLKGQA